MPIALLVYTFIFILLILPAITKTNAEKKHCIEHEKTLLLELRHQLVVDSSVSPVLAKWNRSDDCCRWEGVGCDGGGRVTSLDLSIEGFCGGFNESSSLFGLDYLEELNVSGNVLEESQIITEFQKLKHLTSLILINCSLNGHFPEVIFHLPTLKLLDLSSNPSLTGTIPQIPLNNSFTTLTLKDTNFSGSLPADSFSNLKRLSYLDLSGCRFSGTIPPALANLTRLIHLDLSHNFFTGSISSIHFEALSYLDIVDLSYNSLSGTIPTSLFTLPSLFLLCLSNNRFSGQVDELPTLNISTRFLTLDLRSNRLESPIPNSFFNLQSLVHLRLSDNLFNDTFHLEKILSLPDLEALYLSRNSLSLASIPSSLDYFLVLKSSLWKLDLSDNKIAWEIPSWIWEIGNGSLNHLNLSCNMLVDLQKPYNIPASFSPYLLDLHSNQLRGVLPSSLLRGAVYVDYANNRLSGSFPTSLCDATNLQYLDLSNNNLSGTIPPCLFENIMDLNPSVMVRGEIPDNCSLVTLDLSNNNLVGELPLSIKNCRSLQIVNLSKNKLSGTVPTSLTQLSVLNLGRNNFTGRIPNFRADCPLQYLVLNNNNLTGEVPTSLANCKLLEVMNVGYNYIEDNFPCMLPSSLHVLVLRSNRFHGDITCRKNKRWSNLQIIDVASNNFSGYLNPFNFATWRGMTRNSMTKLSYRALDFTVGDDLWVWRYYREDVTLTVKGVEQKLVKIWPDFTSIDFSNNNFNGDIPDSIGGLDGLYLLNLSHNSLTGTIPKSFGNLTLLGALDISVNRLTGNIPAKIAGLTFLAVMNVSHNKLVGEIPVSTQIQSFPADCFQGNAGLCGLPLNISCPSTGGRLSPPEQGDEESEREEIEWGYVFAAAGYAVGLGSFSWLLLFCRSFRYNYFEKIDDVFATILDRCKCKTRRGRGRRVGRNQVTRK